MLLEPDHAPPALSFVRPGKRKYSVVTPEVKWATITDARKNHSVPNVVLALRSDLREYGCHRSVAEPWVRKEHRMYAKRITELLTTVCHDNMVSDGGMHSYNEALVAVCYCWEVDQAMHCPWQHLVPGKTMTELDLPGMEEDKRFMNHASSGSSRVTQTNCGPRLRAR